MPDSPQTSLSGVGLHGGLPARLDLALRPDSGFNGVVFGMPGDTRLSVLDMGRLDRTARRSTLLSHPAAAGGGLVVRTPEHLLASLLFFSGFPLDVRCDALEIPGLDGSALPFREALAGLAPQAAARPAWTEYPCDLAWEYHWSYGSIRVRPADRFRVRFELDRAPLRQAFLLENAATAWREILPARTFVFHREWVQARAEGLMAGAQADSGLLLAESEAEHADLLRAHQDWTGGPFPLLNRPAWRMDAEPVKHKILDLLGDLALLGLALPALDVEIRNGGHHINHILIERIAAAR